MLFALCLHMVSTRHTLSSSIPVCGVSQFTKDSKYLSAIGDEF